MKKFVYSPLFGLLVCLLSAGIAITMIYFAIRAIFMLLGNL